MTENKPDMNIVPDNWDDIFSHPRFVGKLNSMTKSAIKEALADSDTKIAELEGTIKSFNDSKLEEEGKFKEIAEAQKVEIASLKEAAKLAELTVLKSTIAAESGLPPALASRLSGDDEESIRKDVETMLQYTKGTEAPPPGKGITNKKPGDSSNAKDITKLTPADVRSMSTDEIQAAIGA